MLKENFEIFHDCVLNIYIFFFHLLSQRIKIAPVHAIVFLRSVDVLYHKKRPFNYRANSRQIKMNMSTGVFCS